MTTIALTALTVTAVIVMLVMAVMSNDSNDSVLKGIVQLLFPAPLVFEQHLASCVRIVVV